MQKGYNPERQSKGFSAVFILIGTLVIAVAIVAGAFLVKQTVNFQPKAASPVTQPTPTTKPQVGITPMPTVIDETVYTEGTRSANWKTYLSNDKTFSFKYPSEWILETKSTTTEIQGQKYDANSIVGGVTLTEEQRKAQGYININDAPKTYRNFTLVYSNSPNFKDLTLDNLVEGFILKMTIKENIDFNKNIVLDNNVTAREVGYGCQDYCRDILFQHNNTIFDSSTGPNADANISTLRQILSTFKFN